ncbi:WD40-repeat-containing domain protein [Hysterangium stoloniferum]|nr:WD40-repeat-containing domain protein [Hysterangium stoloniferum]
MAVINLNLTNADNSSPSQQLVITLQFTLLTNVASPAAAHKRQMTDDVSDANNTYKKMKLMSGVGVSDTTSETDVWLPLIAKIKEFINIAEKIVEVHFFAPAALTVITSIPKVIIAQINRDSRIKRLLVSMNDMYTVVIEAEKADLGRIASQQEIIERMISQTTDCARFIHKYAVNKNFWIRGVKNLFGTVNEAIKTYEDAFKNIREAFQGTAVLQTETLVFKVLDDINHMAAKIDLNNIHYAKNARFDSDKGCLPGTREAIISEIIDWVNHPIQENFPRVFFLYGVAGSGKSAIAHTIATEFHKVKWLGSSYFFDRNQSESLHAGNLFRTLSRDIADLDSKWRESLWNIVKDELALCSTNAVKDQFEKLFLQPGQQLDRIDPILIVIDALDECPDKDDHCRRNLLKLLGKSKNIKRIPKNFRILITSRPEPDILEAFQNRQDNVIYKAMPDTEDDSTEHDISLFISNELDSLDEKLNSRWPNREWHQLLVNKAGGLFQWAYVACSAIKDGKTGHSPRQKLNNFLKSVNQLDGLYKTILQQVSPSSDKECMNNYFRVMGTILLAKEPLPISALIALCWPGGMGDIVQSLLRPLGSLLHGVTETSVPIHPLHISFRDFLMDESRSGEYFIDQGQQCEYFTSMIFNVMSKELKFNICGIETSYLLNEAIDDLDDKVAANISVQLAYACRFWADHLYFSPGNLILLEKMESFIKNSFLYWLEVLSVSNEVGRVDGMLLDAAQWMELHNADAKFVRDAAVFCTTFKTILVQSTPHIYLSALPFAPQTSVISRCYWPKYAQLFRVEYGGDETWPRVQQVLAGHTSIITTVAISPNGRLIVSGCSHGTLRLWDSATGTCVHGPLKGHRASVECVAISPDGKFIVSGSEDHTLRLWDLAKGRSVYGPLEGHTNRVTCISISSDGKLIVSGSKDHTLRLWDPATGSSIHSPLKGHRDEVTCVAISPNGKFIISGSWDHTLRLWDPATQCGVYTLEGHTNGVTCVAISPDGKFIVSGSSDHTLRLWDPATGSNIHGPLKGHRNEVTCVAISPDRKFIISGSYDHTLRLWDPVTGSSVHGPLEGHIDTVTCVAISLNGEFIVSGSSDCTLGLWDPATATGSSVHGSLEGHIHPVISVTISPDGKFIVSGSHDGTLRIWAPATDSSVQGPPEGHIADVTCVAVSTDSKFIVSGSNDGTLRMWDVETGKSLHGTLKGHTNEVTCVAISPDGKFIVSGSKDHTLKLWDPATGSSIHSPLEGHRDDVTCAAISSNGKFIISGSDDHTLRLWDPATQCSVYALEGHTNRVTCIAISPDGKFIVSGSSDHTLRLWDPATGSNIHGPLEGHRDEVTCVAISPDRKFIISGSSDHTLRLWDPTTGSCVHSPLEGYTDRVQCLAISPNGEFIVSGSMDGALRLWDPVTGRNTHGPLEGHTDAVTCITIFSNGKFIVSGSDDHTVRLWDPATGTSLCGPLEGHIAGVNCVAVSPDGGLIVSGSKDNTLRLWDLANIFQKNLSTFDIPSSLSFADSFPMDRQGWISNHSGDLMFWVPPQHQSTLWRPSSRAVICGKKGRGTLLDFTHFVHGANWENCEKSVSNSLSAIPITTSTGW